MTFSRIIFVLVLVLVSIPAQESLSRAVKHPGTFDLARVECIQGGAADVCGNGICDSGEECDGTNFCGKDCVGLGYPLGGTLSCTDNCELIQNCNVAPPTPTPVPTPDPTLCGNGVVDWGEECDGTAFREDVDCDSIGGYSWATPRCTSGCLMDRCSCGDERCYAAECYGERLCSYATSNETDCNELSGCSWNTETGSCEGTHSCDDTEDEAECDADASFCSYRPAMNACFGPMIECGQIREAGFDNSGETCTSEITCPEVSFYVSLSFCSFDMYVLGFINAPDGYIVINNGSTLTIRKILEELPITSDTNCW